MKAYKQNWVDFTAVPNDIFRYGLSLKALGLFLYIASKPDGWDFSIGGTSSQLKDGKDSVRSAVNELEEAGFLRREHERKSNGQMGDGIWFIYGRPLENPTQNKEKTPKMAEKAILENPIWESDTQVITNQVKTNREGSSAGNPPSPSPSFSECLYKDFSQKEQLQLLQSIMGIYEPVDFGAIQIRVKNSKSRGNVLETVYHWWYQDIHEGKLGSNKYIANEEAVYVDAVPSSFMEASNLMDERLIEKEKLEPGFINSHRSTTPKYDL